jgi:hypothetical protein
MCHPAFGLAMQTCFSPNFICQKGQGGDERGAMLFLLHPVCPRRKSPGCCIPWTRRPPGRGIPGMMRPIFTVSFLGVQKQIKSTMEQYFYGTREQFGKFKLLY